MISDKPLPEGTPLVYEPLGGSAETGESRYGETVYFVEMIPKSPRQPATCTIRFKNGYKLNVRLTEVSLIQ